MAAIPSSPAAAPVRPGDVRALLEGLEAEYLQARAALSSAVAVDGPEPVLAARDENLQRTLEEIRAAMARVDAGTYGRCLRCGGDIPAARLQVRPFAVTCVPCAGAAR